MTNAQAPLTQTTPSVVLPPESVRRILVCQLRQIGDVLLATPSIELLARHYPQAEIHVFTEKKCLPMLQGNPHIHTTWIVDKKAMPTLLHELAFYRKVTAQGFDLVVDFQQLPRCRWVVAMSRAKYRLSSPPPWYNRLLYTHWARPEPAYAAQYKAGVLAPLGIVWNGERPRMYLTDAEREGAKKLLAEMMPVDAPFITVDATHRHVTRRWPAAHYAALMDMLAEAREDMHFLLPYGPGEESEVQAIRNACVHKTRVHVPRLLSLREMAACMERAALHLGNCSAPRHMAVAVGTPSLTLLGSTSPGWTFPSPEHEHIALGLDCQPCNGNTCKINMRCLVELTPQAVLPHVLTLLKGV